MASSLRAIRRFLTRLHGPGLLLIAAYWPTNAAAQARSIQLPAPGLPAATTGPRVFFATADLAALRARKTTAPHATYFSRVKSNADGVLGTANFETLSDDRLSMAAKGAALLDQLGETPPGTRFTRYRDVAVLAIKSMNDRTARDILGNGSLDPLQDSGRLQSIAEAYDMLRGTGLVSADDTALRAKIANWAAAYVGDAQLPFQVNNWQIKSGAALVSAAMAVYDHASSRGWLDKGVAYVNGGLEKMASATGWFREGPHYLNYSLNNLVSAAYAVRNATGTDWLAPLKPLARFAIDTRLPDGSAVPFEEGTSVVFPHHALLGAYPGDALSREMAWAWENSSRATSNYENQQLHAATLFVVHDASIEPLVPATSPTRFFGSDAYYSVLRSTHERAAKQANLSASIDQSNLEFIASRHNTRNPLDLVASGGEKNMLVTSGGGPQVTSSANRSYYLEASSKNVPLVNGVAPFVMEPSQVEVRDRLDTHVAGIPGIVDLVRTSTTAYQGARSVSRTVALVGGEYFVVLDAVSAASAVDVALPWRGRGARTVSSSASAPLVASWSFEGAALDVTAVGSVPVRLTETSGYYAETFGQEEALHGVRIDARGAETRILTYLNPRAGTEAGRTVTDASSGATAALRIERGTTRDLLAAANTASIAGGMLTANASWAFVREESSIVTAFALARGTSLAFDGRALLASSTATTLAATLAPGEVKVEISNDDATAVTLTLSALPGIDLGSRHGATFNGTRLDGDRFAQETNGFVARNLVGGGTLRIATSLPPPMPVDGGPPDAGMVVDGGVVSDAGVVIDGGGVGDGGVVIDAGVGDGGVAPVDGGEASDGGGVVDAADGGAPPRDGGTVAQPAQPGCTASGSALPISWAFILFAFFLWGGLRRRA